MKQLNKNSVSGAKKTTEEQIKVYETISPLLKAAFDEVKEFSKKKQEELLNVKKVKMINRLLEKAKDVLKSESSYDFLDVLDENELPSNSDVVLIMSQYISAMNSFRHDHYRNSTWDVDLGGSWD
ncbi:MAG: hypothetical protein J6X88_01155 [Bacteroidales bacterium]|nr:hypothetical protein [Bacteroidales bacterium]